MRLSLFYNPLVMIDRIAIEINRYRRKRRLKHTPAAGLGLGCIDSMELLELINKENTQVKHVFDIGANIGTWTLLAKAIFPDASVHAFEPLKVHTDKFTQITQGLDKISLHTFCLGSENMDSILNVSSFSDSSSLLDATPLELEEFGIKKSGEEQVNVKRIDGLIEDGSIPAADIVKLDVQGYELEVLKGFGKYINDVSYIIAEVSFREYYHNQPLFLEIANFLKQYNFDVYALGHGTPTGKPLGQIDVLFKKRR